jgi:hypothetical protein
MKTKLIAVDFMYTLLERRPNWTLIIDLVDRLITW